MSKYKYYFKKPKVEIAKDILLWLITGSAVVLAASSPYFIRNIMSGLEKRNRKPYSNKKAYDTFYRLQKEGCINFARQKNQLYVSLTEKGKRRAGVYQINDLQLHKSKQWDGLWRVVIFDIKEKHRIKREALRGFLKRLEFYPLQQSVWLSPYECRDEVRLLKDFFGFQDEEVRLLITGDIENDSKLRKHFQL
ncbi:MAG: hypothetical protein A3C82_00605 [Candidatus Wildermuthbacteria bacterium RIFCSPHIGHO2_02_FULL_47_12]|uniref:Transcriptional repressor PaaX-like central Cas2-like domain-containing protein n=1 Tax=Candidatus Wildermuthbacteria bacterium RIFCSPHIGHO2_02_FULL_47_12 TaxID=1802451 RepID=A0A1G2R2T6_9BACT|nr:MAG: hypothetical protein A3C82_00605 [Candidatus Wildermuthbacteria bacterium RIFCSPHIGHO2_02_FULL_47_12]